MGCTSDLLDKQSLPTAPWRVAVDAPSGNHVDVRIDLDDQFEQHPVPGTGHPDSACMRQGRRRVRRFAAVVRNGLTDGGTANGSSIRDSSVKRADGQALALPRAGRARLLSSAGA